MNSKLVKSVIIFFTPHKSTFYYFFMAVLLFFLGMFLTAAIESFFWRFHADYEYLDSPGRNSFIKDGINYLSLKCPYYDVANDSLIKNLVIPVLANIIILIIPLIFFLKSLIAINYRKLHWYQTTSILTLYGVIVGVCFISLVMLGLSYY